MQLYGIKKLLNIPEYKVKEIISITDKEIHIRLEAYKRKKIYLLKVIGTEHRKGYHSKKEVKVEDLPIACKRVYLYFRKQRYFCPKDGRIHTEEISWVKLKDA